MPPALTTWVWYLNGGRKEKILISCTLISTHALWQGIPNYFYTQGKHEMNKCNKVIKMTEKLKYVFEIVSVTDRKKLRQNKDTVVIT